MDSALVLDSTSDEAVWDMIDFLVDVPEIVAATEDNEDLAERKVRTEPVKEKYTFMFYVLCLIFFFFF